MPQIPDSNDVPESPKAITPPDQSPDTVRFDPPAAEPKTPEVTIAKAEGRKLPSNISPEQARQIREVEAKIRRVQESIPSWAWKAGLIAIPVLLGAGVAVWWMGRAAPAAVAIAGRRKISVRHLAPLAASAKPALGYIRQSLRGMSRRHIDAVLGPPDAERGSDRVRQALYLLVDVMNPGQRDTTAVAVEYDENGNVEEVEFLHEVPGRGEIRRIRDDSLDE